MISNTSAKQVMINTSAILAVLFGAWFLVQIRSTIVLFVFGILFASAIEPIVNRLRRRGLGRGQAILVVYLGILIVLAAIVFAVVPPLASQGSKLLNDIPDLLQNLRTQARSSDSKFIRDTGTRAIDEAMVAYAKYRANPPIGSDQAFAFATTVGGGIVTVITVMTVAFYWMTEKSIVKRLVLGLFPIEGRDRVHGLWDEIEARIGGWTRGQLLLCFVIGGLSTIGYRVIGLEFWLPLGLLAGFTEIIPFVGPVIGGAAAFAVALTDSWQTAVIVLIFAIALQQLEGAFLVPRVMKNAVGMTPLTVILAVLIGSSLAGALGAVLAIPIGAATQVLISELLSNRADDPDNRAHKIRPRLSPQVDPVQVEPVIAVVGGIDTATDGSTR